jgi:hypothetical protein
MAGLPSHRPALRERAGVAWRKRRRLDLEQAAQVIAQSILEGRYLFFEDGLADPAEAALAAAPSPGRSGRQLGHRERLRDRAVALAVEHEPDVTAAYLDALGVGHELGLPADDAVGL